MSKFNNKERAALAAGLETLRRCNKYLCKPVKKSELEDNSELNEYLLRPFWGNSADIERDKAFEKAIKTSIIKSRKKITPVWLAKRRADAFVESMRNARIDVLYENGISAKEYEKLKKDNYVANTVVAVKRVKRFAKRKGIRYAASAALGIAAWPVGLAMFAGNVVWDILPTRHKQKLKDKAKKIIATTKEKVVSSMQTLAKQGAKIANTVGETLTSAVKTLANKGKEFVKAVKETVDVVKDIVVASPVVQKTKEVAKKVWKKITSWF